MTDRRFHIAARVLVAANHRFEVFFDRLEGPDDIVVPQYLMLRPKVLRDGVSGACVLPEVDGRIGLMRTWRHQFGEEIWQAPAGFAEPDETITETARRELREEVGLDCAPDDLKSLGLAIPDAGFLEAKVALFVAAKAQPVTTERLEEPGLGTLEFLSRRELQALLATTSTMGSATAIACYRYLSCFDATE